MSGRRMGLRGPVGEPQPRTSGRPSHSTHPGSQVTASLQKSYICLLVKKAAPCPYLTYVSRIEIMSLVSYPCRYFECILQKGTGSWLICYIIQFCHSNVATLGPAPKKKMIKANTPSFWDLCLSWLARSIFQVYYNKLCPDWLSYTVLHFFTAAAKSTETSFLSQLTLRSTSDVGQILAPAFKKSGSFCFLLFIGWNKSWAVMKRERKRETQLACSHASHLTDVPSKELTPS